MPREAKASRDFLFKVPWGKRMNEPNQYGVYEPQITEKVARCGHGWAAIEFAVCKDRLYHYALDCFYSHGGFADPITIESKGYKTIEAAREAGLRELLIRIPSQQRQQPAHIINELKELESQVRIQLQPATLF
jgi:hypothetical protein